MTDAQAHTDYLMMIWAHGMPAPEELATMQREIPAWVREVDGRGIRRLGRELDLPETAVTVRVRDGETVVSDGPFIEAKEFAAGFDVLSCADLDEAVSVAASSPISSFQTLELLPLRGGVRWGEPDRTAAFASSDDGSRDPFLLALWADTAAPSAGSPRPQSGDTWRDEADARGVAILGGTLQGPDAARTVRVRDGETLVGDGPLPGSTRFLAGIEVVSCADREEAVALAAAHPFARDQAIEVRPFYRER